MMDKTVCDEQTLTHEGELCRTKFVILPGGVSQVVMDILRMVSQESIEFVADALTVEPLHHLMQTISGIRRPVGNSSLTACMHDNKHPCTDLSPQRYITPLTNHINTNKARRSAREFKSKTSAMQSLDSIDNITIPPNSCTTFLIKIIMAKKRSDHSLASSLRKAPLPGEDLNSHPHV